MNKVGTLAIILGLVSCRGLELTEGGSDVVVKHNFHAFCKHLKKIRTSYVRDKLELFDLKNQSAALGGTDILMDPKDRKAATAMLCIRKTGELNDQLTFLQEACESGNNLSCEAIPGVKAEMQVEEIHIHAQPYIDKCLKGEAISCYQAGKIYALAKLNSFAHTGYHRACVLEYKPSCSYADRFQKIVSDDKQESLKKQELSIQENALSNQSQMIYNQARLLNVEERRYRLERLKFILNRFQAY